MNNMLMQRIVDEVVFRLKQRAGKTLVLTVFQLRDASVQESVHQYASLQIRYVDLPLLRQLAENETSDRAAIQIHEALAWGLHIQLSGNDSNLLIVFYVQIMPDDFVMQLHRF